jgi:putative NIF3 family GTP cyclohydrolase 1 type 2
MATLKELYDLAVTLGIDADPRGRAGVEKYLAKKKKDYDGLSKEKQAEYSSEDLTNPYSDSRILCGDPSTSVRSILAGIDIDAAEMLLADRLNQKGETIDLVIAHHPNGESYAALHEVMDMQADLMAKYGVPINIAEGLLRERISQVGRKIHPINHTQAVDAARLLGIAHMCTHTITDNLVYDFFEKMVAGREFDTVGDVLAMIKEIPEYKEAIKGKAGPTIVSGSEKSRAGRVVPLEITGGTNAAENVYERLSHAGVGTIISMHASEEHLKEAQKHHINMVIAGHMSSDSLGMNLLLDKYEAKGIKIIPCSGLIRVSRNN